MKSTPAAIGETLHRLWGRAPATLTFEPVFVMPALLALTLFARALLAQQSFELDKFFQRAFLTREFQPKRFGPARWLGKGEAYTTLERSKDAAGASDLVRYDTETGKREVLIAGSDLTPKGSEKALTI